MIGIATRIPLPGEQSLRLDLPYRNVHHEMLVSWRGNGTASSCSRHKRLAQIAPEPPAERRRISEGEPDLRSGGFENRCLDDAIGRCGCRGRHEVPQTLNVQPSGCRSTYAARGLKRNLSVAVTLCE